MIWTEPSAIMTVMTPGCKLLKPRSVFQLCAASQPVLPAAVAFARASAALEPDMHES